MIPAELVLARLRKVRESGAGWTASCPAHEDRRPSLSIQEAQDGRVLLHCHAGCEVEAICGALGMEVRELFPSATPTPRTAGSRRTIHETVEAAIRAAKWVVEQREGSSWSLVQQHAYPDPSGSDAMRVLRFEKGGEKTFTPIHRCDGGWAIGDPPGKLPLYNLPALKGAETVYIVEGEKAADAARAIGLVCTTSAHGAEAAKKTDWRPLAGREVVLLPDNDDPGRKYAQQVADILIRSTPPATVRVVDLPELPEHGDMVEFIEARRAARASDATMRTEIEGLASATEAIVGSAGCPSDEAQGASVSSVSTSGGAFSEFGDPEPLPDLLPPVQQFDLQLLPGALQPWITDMAERIQCPPDYCAVAAMVGLAGIVGRKVGIRPKRQDDWLVVPNLYGAVIGRPGIMKSPAIAGPLVPLRTLEIEAKERFIEELNDHEAAQLVQTERKKLGQNDIKKALKEGKDASALAVELVRGEQPEPTRRRYLVNDSTVEKVGEILAENPNGVVTFRDELTGLLRYLDKEGHEGARAFYLEAWNGNGRYTYDRIGRGTIDIEAAILSVVGGIQPGPLGAYLRAAVKSGAGDDGLIQRFQLAVWPDHSKQWRNVDRWPNSEAKQRAFETFRLLDSLDPNEIGAELDRGDPEAIPFLRFAPDAQEVFDAWRADLEVKVRSGEEHPAIEAHLAKYRSLIPSLALLIHLADHRAGPVQLDALDRAIRWGTYLETHARRIYSQAVGSDVVAAHELAKRLRRGEVGESFSLRDVYRRAWTGLASRDEVRPAAEYLEDLGWLMRVQEQTPGRTRTRYLVNPQIPKSPPGGTDRTDKRVGGGASVSSVSTSGRGIDETDPISGNGSEANAVGQTPPGGTDRTDKRVGEETSEDPDGGSRGDETPEERDRRLGWAS